MIDQSIGRSLRMKPKRPDSGIMTWYDISEQRKDDFYEYLEENFKLTKEEFQELLKKHHPESLI